MSILAAKCPCCGRDIGFEDNTEEYTCVFCGTQLQVSALKTQLVANGAASAKAEAPKKDPAPRTEKQKKHYLLSKDVHSADDIDPKEVGLTREEIEEQLKRKAEYKEELHSVVRQIDEFRARRPKLEARRKTVSTLTGIGVGLAVAAAAALALFVDGDGEYNDLILIACGVIAVVALVMLITSAIQRSDVKKQQSRLEETIIEKKQKRDVLIGRLNKINKTLHIHSSK